MTTLILRRARIASAGLILGALRGAAVGSPVSFSGSVPAQSGTTGGAASLALAGYFAGTFTPFTYTVASGALPAGLSLNASTGAITGNYSAAGGFSAVVRATDANGNTASTNSIAWTVAAATAAPVVTLNPVPRTTVDGASVVFTSAATGTPAPSVQWQSSSDGGVTPLDIVGEVGPSYTRTAALADNGLQFRAKWSNAAGDAYSSWALLTVGASGSVRRTLRERIIEQAVLTLGPTETASGRVFRARQDALSREESPSVVLEPSEDAPAAEFSGFIDKQLALDVSIYARADTAGGRSADEVADLPALSAYELLMADTTLGGLALDVSPGAAGWRFDEADADGVWLTTTFTVLYRHQRNDLTA